jgi:hypothetical protein
LIGSPVKVLTGGKAIYRIYPAPIFDFSVREDPTGGPHVQLVVDDPDLAHHVAVSEYSSDTSCR